VQPGKQVGALYDNLRDFRQGLGVFAENIVLVNGLVLPELALVTIEVNVAQDQEKTQIVGVFENERFPLSSCENLDHNSVQNLSASVDGHNICEHFSQNLLHRLSCKLVVLVHLK